MHHSIWNENNQISHQRVKHTCSLKYYMYSKFPDCLPVQLFPHFSPAGTFHGRLETKFHGTLEISC